MPVNIDVVPKDTSCPSCGQDKNAIKELVLSIRVLSKQIVSIDELKIKYESEIQALKDRLDILERLNKANEGVVSELKYCADNLACVSELRRSQWKRLLKERDSWQTIKLIDNL